MISSTNLSLVEFPNLKSLKNIWKHPLIHESQKLNIKKYCNACIDGKVNVEYFMKYEYGRLQLKDATVFSSVAQWNAVRSTLFSDTEYDIDIVGCHQNILLGICKGVVVCNNLEYYGNNRGLIIDSIHIADIAITKFNELNQDNKTKKDFVKSLFTIIMYGGNIATWEKEFGITNDDYKLTPFVNDFIDEILMLADVVINLPQYKPIKTQVFKKEKTKRIRQIDYENANKKDKRKKDAVFDVDKFHVKSCKTLSIILQDIERLIILDAFAFLQVLHKVTITSYNYDGFQVLKSTFDTDLIPLLNKEIAKKWKYIEFIVKPFSPQLDMTLIPEPIPVIDVNEFNLIESYEYKKSYIERFIVHCQTPSMYVVLNADGDVINKTTSTKLLESYNHFKYNDEDGKEKSFMGRWVGDPNKHSLSKYEYNPPPVKTPSYNFNAWNGWAIDHIEYKKADTTKIYNHIRFMAGLSNTEEVYEYLLNWFAWCVQFPALKTMVCLIFYGKQRSGKSCIAENLLSVIMGKRKLMVTGSVDKIFGKHSEVGDKHLVVLNEANGKDTKNIHEVIKDAISRETVITDPKGIEAFESTDYVNYIMTTNNISAVDVPSDDSRFMPIAVNNCLIGNIDYFKELRADMDDIDVMGSFYDDLMKRDLTGWNACTYRPMTDLKSDMVELSISPYQEFINWLYIDLSCEFNDNNNIISYTGSDLYYMFKRFWGECGRFNQPSTQTKFGIELKRLDGVECKKIQGVMKYKITRIEKD
jgi:hypothetical protein